MIGVGIRYGQALAGILETTTVPRADGEYGYMPLRSPAHLEMCQAVAAGERPLCRSADRESTVTFRVVALPRVHVMVLTEVLVQERDVTL